MLDIIALAIVLLLDAVYLIVLVSINLPYQIQEIKKLPRVSVIIAAKDGTVIERTLRQLKKAAVRKEIIVVSASSETLRIAKKYGAKVVKDAGIGKGAALNSAVRHASSKILYFMDEDMIVRQDTIEKVCSALGKYEVAVGMNLPENSGTLTASVARIYISLLSKIQCGLYRLSGTTLVGGRNLAIYKSTLGKMGGFRNMLTEDMDLSFRLFEKRKKVKFVHAVAYDQVPEKFYSYLRQQQRWNVGTGEAMKKWKKHLRFSDMSLIGMLLMLGFLAPLSLIFLAAGIAFASVAFLTVPVLGFLLCLTSAERKDLATLPLTFFAFLGVHTYTLVYSKARKPKGWYRTPKN